MAIPKEILEHNVYPTKPFTTGEQKPVHRTPYFPLSEPGKNIETELQRRIVDRVEEVNVSDWRALNEFSAKYFDLMTDPDNLTHFTGVPDNVEELKDTLKTKGKHGLAVFNKLDQVVGFAIIEDPAKDEFDARLSKFGIINNLQNIRPSDPKEIDKKIERPRNVGRQALGKILDWAFNNPTHSGNERIRIDAFVMFAADGGRISIDGWNRMYRLFTDAGAEIMYQNPDTAWVLTRGEKTKVRGDSMRMKLFKDTWEKNKYKFSGSN